MPTFDTPDPILVTLELGVGALRIVATERTDTVVDVGPTDPAEKSDVTAAAETRVEYAAGRLLIRAAKGWRRWTLRGGRESVDVRIGLPAGSELRGDAGIAGLHGTGRLGECRFKTGIGEIRIERAGPVQLKTGGGDITVDRALSHAELTAGTGSIRVGSIDGTGVVKVSNGDTWIGEATGELRVNAANGKIAVDRAGAGVTAKTANGDVHIGEVASGAILAQTACGKVEIGIREGVAAWLDLDTRCGNVDNGLEAAQGPEAGEDAVEVRARSAFGDITVRRATDPPAAERPSGSGSRFAQRS
jgi:DUF4097 and DUF4098 domain-containing protein YvlB